MGESGKDVCVVDRMTYVEEEMYFYGGDPLGNPGHSD